MIRSEHWKLRKGRREIIKQWKKKNANIGKIIIGKINYENVTKEKKRKKLKKVINQGK